MPYDQWKADVITLATKYRLMWLLGDDEISLEERHSSGMSPKEAIQSLYEGAGCPIDNEPQ